MPFDPHEVFRELCALSTSGELTEEEWSRLNDHLIDCNPCRELKSQYERVVTMAIPSLAREWGSGRDGDEAQGTWSIDRAEARLIESLRSDQTPPSLTRRSRWIPSLRYAIAALILGGCTVTAYRAGVLRGRGVGPAVDPVRLEMSTAAPLQNPSQGEKGNVPDEETSKLRSQVRFGQLEIAALNEKLDQAEQELATRGADLERYSGERTELSRELAEARTSQQSLEAKLDATGSQSSQQTVELLDLKSRMNGLNTALGEKDREIARERELLERDRDIRSLIGARNLYIAEIYDVSKTGDTEKPFGRVFYTKDKSLVFYGYDLDQQKGVRKDASFQAWGRRGTDRHEDLSLGLLYQDEANKNRWVLRFNDSKTIDQIDAVFITAEPEGGSSKPTGKPLLFTYLRLDPNHP